MNRPGTLLLGWLLCLAPAGTWAAPSIVVPARAEVGSPVVRLGDVARLSGFAPEARQRVANIDLGPAPVVGTGRLLPRAYLAAALADSGLARGVALRLPDRLEVTRAARPLKGAELSRDIEREVRRALPPGTQVGAIHVPLLADLRIPTGAAVTVRAERPGNLEGPVTAVVEVTDAGQVVRSQKVAVRVDTLSTVYVAADVLARGALLDVADLRPVTLPESQIPPDAVRDPREISGARLRRDVKGGETLSRRYLELPPLVSRGERVTMIAARGGVRLTAVGEALASGRRGDSVKVRNIDSQRIVAGRVVGPQTVEMEL